MKAFLFLASALLASACGVAADEEGPGSVWSPPTPPADVFLSEVISYHEADLRAAMDLWNEAAGIELLNFAGLLSDADALSETPNGASSVAALSRWKGSLQMSATPGMVLAAATVRRDEGGQVERDIYLNFESYAFDADGPSPGKRRISPTIVLAHELGHLLGLDHTESPEDVMYFATGSAQSFRLTPGDIKELRKKLRLPQ